METPTKGCFFTLNPVVDEKICRPGLIMIRGEVSKPNHNSMAAWNWLGQSTLPEEGQTEAI